MNKTLYICPMHDRCHDAKNCKHMIPHEAVLLDDNCLTEPCPAYFGLVDEDDKEMKVICVVYSKPIQLPEELFEI